MSVPAPNPVESQELLFKVLCRLRVFPSQSEQFKSSKNLVAAAPKYGLVFVGMPNGFQVLQSSKLSELALSTRSESSEYPRREIYLNATPSHFSVSCDQAHLVVGLVQDTCAIAYVYDISKFCSKTIPVINSIRLATTPGCVILDLHFNPGIPNIIAACTSDGGVGVYEMKGPSIDVNTLPPATQATCLCWSPKGKQLVIGDKNGVLTQYKPDLKQVKGYPPPPDKQSWSIINVLWVSNYQFVAVYADSVHTEERPCIMVVNVPKGGAISYINYEDICYSAGDFRPPQYYLLLQGTWNIMMVASANSIEVGVLALLQDQVSWQQWTQEDAARAEIPLTLQRQETYPVGMALDTSSTHQLPWGESQSLQPMPLLYILSHDGVLCVYNAINIQPGAACVCSPPQPLSDVSGLDQFTLGQGSLVEPPQPVHQPPPQSFVSSSAPAIVPFSQPPSLAQSISSSSGLFATPVSVTAVPGGAPPTSSGSAFSFSSLPVVGSGDTISKLSGAVPSSNAPLAFQPSQPAVPKSDLAAPQIISTPKPLPPLVPVPPIQQAEPLTQQQRTSHQEELSTGTAENVDDKGESIDPTMYLELIQGEIRDFQTELSKLISSSQGFSEIGTKDEKEVLLHKVNTLEHFVKELKETTKGQRNEITGLQALVMESYSWVEDAKSRHQQLNDPSYLQLVRAQELDLASKLRMSNIQQLHLYVENQLHEVDKHLDSQWGEFQDSMRDVKNRLYIPTIEEVYQTMVKQNKILAKQQCILEDVSQRIASRKLRNSNRIPLISDSVLTNRATSRRLPLNTKDSVANNNLRSETDLSSLAENLLEMKLRSRKSEESALDNIVDRAKNLNISRSRHALTSQKLLSRKKENALRERVMQLPMAHIKPDRTPSDTIGERPSVSFNSAVLQTSSRKVRKESELLPSISPSASSVGKTSTPNVQALSMQPGKAPASNVSSDPTPSVRQISGAGAAVTKPQFIPEALMKKDVPSKASTVPVTVKNPPLQTTNTFAQKTTVQKSTAPSLLKADAPAPATSSSTPVSASASASLFATSPVANKPEAVKLDFTKPVIPKPTKSEPGSIFKLPAGGSQSTGFSFSLVTSTPKSSDTVSFGSFATSTPAKADSQPPTATEGSKSPLASLGNLIDNISTPTPQPKTSSEPAPLISNSSSAFTSSVASKPSDSSAKHSTFSFLGSNASAATSLSPTIFGSSFGVPTSKPTLAPTSSKAATPSLFTPSMTVGSVTITPVTVPAPPTAVAASPSSSIVTPQPDPPASVATTSSMSTAPEFTPSSAVSTAPTISPADGGSSLFGGIGLGGSPMAANKSAASIFGGSSGSGLSKEGVAELFSTPASSSGLVITSVSGASSPAKSLLGTPASAASTISSSTPSIFGGSSATSAPAVTSAPTVSSEGAALFGQGLTTSATIPTPSVSTATPSPAFGQEPATSTAAVPSTVFGQALTISAPTPAPATSATSPLFGQAAAAAAPATTPSTVFGQPQTAVSGTLASSSFSFVPSTTAPSLFGGAPTSGASSGFSFATSASTAATTTSASSSFTFALPASAGSAAPESSGKSFSFASPTAPASTASQSVFGSSPAPLFGQTATSTPAPASFFGQQICSPTSTSQSSSIFGGSPSVASSGFSQPATTAQSLFSSTPSMGAFGSKAAFGQSGGSLFGSSAGSTGFTASGTSMFGGGSSGGSVFGGSAASPAGNPFQQASGGSSNNVFGSPSPSAGSFSSSGIGNTISQSGFGSPSSFQQPAQFGGFGSPPAFGSNAAFGSTPAFGSPPTFGGAPAFGSPPKVFGASPTPGFGAAPATTSNTTFEALATQDSGMTFGNLAQSSPPGQPTNVFGGAPAGFGNTGSSFGGKSFSSWR